MTRRGRRPATHPAVFLSIEAITAQTPFLRAILGSFGVRGADVDDLLQEAVLGAWRSMKAGRFCPPPGRPIEQALRSWLVGIAWRHFSHFREKAHRRREIPSGLLDVAPIEVVLRIEPRPEDQIAARRMLLALSRVPPIHRETLLLLAMGAAAKEIAAQLGVNVHTINSRIRLGRRYLLRVLRRQRRT